MYYLTRSLMTVLLDMLIKMPVKSYLHAAIANRMDGIDDNYCEKIMKKKNRTMI